MKDYNTTSYVSEMLDTVPEADKLKEPYLMKNIDSAISDIYRYYKYRAIKAYEIYNGRMKADDYAHLTDNYGVGTPNKVRQMRLMGRRIAALIGKQLQNEIDYNVTASDENSVFLKLQQKKIKMIEEIEEETKRVLGGDTEKNKVFTDNFIKELQDKYGTSWKADFEIAVSDYIDYYKHKKNLKDEFKNCARDYFVTGEMYNRVFVNELNTEPEYWHVDPREFWFERNPNSNWVKDSKRCVYRRLMSSSQIFKELGHLMDEEERLRVAKSIANRHNENTRREILFIEDEHTLENIAVGDGPTYQSDLIEVFHVEWVATNEVKDSQNDSGYNTEAVDLVESSKSTVVKKSRYRQDRYEGYKIELGQGIYLGMGKSKFITRSKQDPYSCTLTYDGMIYNEDNGEPYSIVIATKELSDIYNITHFHLNNLFASIRPGGTYTVLEHLPADFGNTPEERLLKNAGYEKSISQKLISISQEGMEGEYGFNNYGNYPTNMDGQVLQAYMSYIEILEQQADRMLGLNPRMLGEMEERDGKSTTMQAIQQGEIITKELFHMISLFSEKTLERIVNTARLSHKKPFTTAFMQGSNYRAFTLIPEQFAMSDYNVFVTDDKQEIEAMNFSRELIIKAFEQQSLSFSEAFKAIHTPSLSKKIEMLEKADKRVMAQLTQQVEQLTQQSEQLAAENERLNKLSGILAEKEVQIKEKEAQLKAEDMELKNKIEEDKLALKEKELSDKNKIEQQKINAEILEFYDTNKQNDEFNQNR